MTAEPIARRNTPQAGETATRGEDAPRAGAKLGRLLITFRLARVAVEHIDGLARQENVLDRYGKPNRSEMLRILLTYAVRHRPKGWKP